MISREIDYAIRIILGVAGGKGGLVSASEVSERMKIPYRFLRKISLALVKAGILQSRRGSGGGLVLSRPVAEINLLDVIIAISAKGTGINLCLREDTGCEFAPNCKLHPKLKNIQNMLNKQLAAIRFNQLL